MTADDIANARVTDALESIERAQRQLDDAAQALSAVSGFAREYTRVCARSEGVRRLWHAVDSRRRLLGEKTSLDHEIPTPSEVRRWGQRASAMAACDRHGEEAGNDAIGE
jgi:hypothetical protein